MCKAKPMEMEPLCLSLAYTAHQKEGFSNGSINGLVNGGEVINSVTDGTKDVSKVVSRASSNIFSRNAWEDISNYIWKDVWAISIVDLSSFFSHRRAMLKWVRFVVVLWLLCWDSHVLACRWDICREASWETSWVSPWENSHRPSHRISQTASHRTGLTTSHMISQTNTHRTGQGTNGRVFRNYNCNFNLFAGKDRCLSSFASFAPRLKKMTIRNVRALLGPVRVHDLRGGHLNADLHQNRHVNGHLSGHLHAYDNGRDNEHLSRHLNEHDNELDNEHDNGHGNELDNRHDNWKQDKQDDRYDEITVRYPGGEVIGSTGRIGSYLLHRLNTSCSQQRQQPYAASPSQPSHFVAATPRGVSPGCLSPPQSPIYVCVPSSSLRSVWEATVPHRRGDLVFIGNFIPSRHLRSLLRDSESGVTVAIPHFGVPHAMKSTEQSLESLDLLESLDSLESLKPRARTSPDSPPTVIYGKHATRLAELLADDDIPVQILHRPEQVQVAAVRKLLWSSFLWLLCHTAADEPETRRSLDVSTLSQMPQMPQLPLSVKQAHDYKSDQIRLLVEEALPSLQKLASEPWQYQLLPRREEQEEATSRKVTNESDPDWGSNDKEPSMGTVDDNLRYLKKYSMSLSRGAAVPSLELALCEFHERNGLLLSMMVSMGRTAGENEEGKKDGQASGRRRSSHHLKLIRQVADKELLSPFFVDGDDMTSRQNEKDCVDPIQDILIKNEDSKEEDPLASNKLLTTMSSSTRVRCTSTNLEFLIHSSQSHHSNDGRGNGEIDVTQTRSVVVIGAGMIGSSIAHHLAMHASVKVTVLDQRRHLLPSASKINVSTSDPTRPPPKKRTMDAIDPGMATSSTFAWINANDKSPFPYMQFNHLGMEVWRRHALLRHLPVWCGALLRRQGRDFNAAKNEHNALTQEEKHWRRKLVKHRPYYSVVGPMNKEEVQSLEPGVDWSKSTAIGESDSHGDNSFYFYPEEGHVDPTRAVAALRRSAAERGVVFVEGVRLHALVRGVTDEVTGVEYWVENDGSSERRVLEADVVVIAAGANSSFPLLGIGSDRLPMLEQPGIIAYARSDPKDSSYSVIDGQEDSGNMHAPSQQLRRIFVDAISKSHVLRRSDGTLVVGGGELVVGGTADRSLDHGRSQNSFHFDDSSLTHSSSEDIAIGKKMVQTVAEAIAPFELLPCDESDNQSSDSKFVRLSRANRPMPNDGLPVVGYIDPGLYVAVTHSGITLGPLLGELAAYEVANSNVTEIRERLGGIDKRYGFVILDDYRPSRF